MPKTFVEAFVGGQKNALVKAVQSIDRLQLMPKTVKDGKVYDFRGEFMFDYDGPDIEFLKKDRSANRLTGALQRDYLGALNPYFGLIRFEVGSEWCASDEGSPAGESTEDEKGVKKPKKKLKKKAAPVEESEEEEEDEVAEKPKKKKSKKAAPVEEEPVKDKKKKKKSKKKDK